MTDNESLVKVVSRVALALVVVLLGVSACVYGVRVENNKTQRACVDRGLDKWCNIPDGD